MSQIAAQRRHQLLELTNQHGIISVRQLCDSLGVSDMTVRRDVRALAHQGVLLRTRGGAISLSAATGRYTYSQREMLVPDVISLIGAAAASLVENGDTICLGSGTTVLALARCLHDHERLTVITDSIHVVADLLGVDGITVIATGGVASGASGSFVGSLAENALTGFRARKAFIGATSVSPEGFSNNSLDEAVIHRKMITFSSETFVLADHSKFGDTSLALMAELHGVSGVVTDDETSEEALGWLRDAGLRVFVAPR